MHFVQNKQLRLLSLLACFLFAASASAADDWTPLFNGEDLTGWSVQCKPTDQEKAYWSVVDGVIQCDSIGQPDHDYVWLATDQEYDDFELRLQFQIFESSKGNSGVQVRSRYDSSETARGGGWLDGPQIDIHPPTPLRCGLIYDETDGVNRWIYPSLPNSKIVPESAPPAAHETEFVYADEDPTAWNSMRIRCIGMKIETWVNGRQITDFDASGILDDETHRAKNVGEKGVIALQLHSRSELLIRFREIDIREATASVVASRPNLVIVYTDQMRGQAMGFLGQEPVLTPNLDQFSTESLVLTEACANYPVCSPSRAMLMTGKFPHANGVPSNCTSATAVLGCELRESDVCWSDLLDDAGYSLGYIGKWHLDGPYEPFVESYNNGPNFAWNEWCPPNRRHGFDFWYAYGTFDQHMTPEYWSTDMTRDERVKVEQWGPEHETDQAIRYIQNEDGSYRDSDSPFAMVVSMNPPHTPYGQVPQRYVDMYADVETDDLITRLNVDLEGESAGARTARSSVRNYFAMITGVDDQFGRIMQTLEDEGLTENTIVLFTADHGNNLGSHNVPTKNVHHDESMIVPFMIRWPDHIASRQDDLLISTPDIYPTLMGLMGLEKEVPATVQGVSHENLFLTGEGDRPESALYMWTRAEDTAAGRRGVRTHRYTLMIEKKEGQPLSYTLHDNDNDPFQLENIAESQPDVVERLIREELVPWLEKNEDPWLQDVEF